MTKAEAIKLLENHHMWTGFPQEINDVRAENTALYMAIESLKAWDRLAGIMRDGNVNGDIACLPNESIGRAESLFEQAIEIIEDSTGEKWDFTYCDW